MKKGILIFLMSGILIGIIVICIFTTNSFKNKTQENNYYVIDEGIDNSTYKDEIIKEESDKDKLVVANNLEEFKNYMQNIYSKFTNYETYEVDYEGISFFAYRADNQIGFEFELLFNNKIIDVYELDKEYSFSENEFYIFENDTDIKFALMLQIAPVGSNERYMLVVFNDKGKVLLSKDIISDNGKLEPIESYMSEIMS